jgi:uncharacterized protein YrrD
MSKLNRVQLRFPNSIGWFTTKIDLTQFEVVSIFDDEVFIKKDNNVVSIKKDTVPKSFLKSR